jgi:hypothetical protein
MEGCGQAGENNRHAVGDHVRLRDEAQAVRSGTIIGFFRRQSLTIVVKLNAGGLIEVRPEDLERL